jgi:hypothetical protein
MKTLSLVGILLISMGVSAQDPEKQSFGVHVGLGNSIIYHHSLEGGPGYEGLASLHLGLDYYRLLSGRLSLASGLNWHHNRLKITPDFYPGMDMTPKYYDCDLIYVPLNLRVDFLHYFYLYGGCLFDMDISAKSNISNQTGLGVDAGIGGEIRVFRNIRIGINPYMNSFGLLRLNYDRYPERVLDSGIRIVIRGK